MLLTNELDQLVKLRQRLHKQPELSGHESDTAATIEEFIKAYNPNEIITQLGGHGLAAIWKGTLPGKTTMIRAELDALPIQETNAFPHKSQKPNISHKCGHDGHMAIVCGIAMLLKKEPVQKGQVILLFQPAEETGKGACAVLEDKKFLSIRPDYAFALHNLPQYNMGTILCKKGSFCAASTGLKILLKGKTAHASLPETGENPALATTQLIQCLDRILETNDFINKALITLTHTQIGEKSFGVSAGEAEVWLTLRAFEKHDFDLLIMLVEKEVNAVVSRHQLSIEMSQHEPFEVTHNHSKGVVLIKAAAEHLHLTYEEMPEPNPWSEDFGLYLQHSEGAMFGLGSGLATPDLHNPDYDFPDELIETGIRMFWQLIHSSAK